ncbi:MAG TPA: TPM domain-containing protein [Eubacteriales bacterium]|nr:TPM domain-containing protein [Clostridia bacterium]HRR89640.1 TPM domain-containing protein [Eubacteriales bacterium]HRU84458.1 TPM domain-containing protein [Eubacteriales bacterium]
MRRFKGALIFSILLAVVAGIVCFGIYIFGGFGKKGYPNPSDEYYINDFAGALLSGTRNVILAEGEALYEDTKGTDLGGAQMVVATVLFDSAEKAEAFDRTELFRKWKIGENDMGLLILLKFVGGGEEKEFYSIEIEIGYRMEQFITAARAGYVLDNCFFNPEWEGSVDLGLGETCYELLRTIYVEAYGYSDFEYDMADYADYVSSADSTSRAQLPMSAFALIFSPLTPLWAKVLGVFVLIIVLGVFGGGGFLGIRGFKGGGSRGGGGSSGGYGIRR